jgi:hypothetical protein
MIAMCRMQVSHPADRGTGCNLAVARGKGGSAPERACPLNAFSKLIGHLPAMSDSGQARSSVDAREPVRADAWGPAVGPGPVKPGERRHEARREPRANRSLAMPLGSDDGHAWFPRKWPYLIVCMLGAVVSSALAAGAVPGPYSSAMLALALAGVCCAQPIFDRAGRARIAARLAVAAAVVALPMFLFGLGMTVWTVRQGLPWDIAVAAMVGVGITSAVYLRRQPGVIFAGQLAMWSAAALAFQSVAGATMLLVALCIAVLISREQLEEQRREEAERQARDRVQTRARDILRDYEDTRQGWFWETDRRSQLTYLSPPVARPSAMRRKR